MFTGVSPSFTSQCLASRPESTREGQRHIQRKNYCSVCTHSTYLHQPIRLHSAEKTLDRKTIRDFSKGRMFSTCLPLEQEVHSRRSPVTVRWRIVPRLQIHTAYLWGYTLLITFMYCPPWTVSSEQESTTAGKSISLISVLSWSIHEWQLSISEQIYNESGEETRRKVRNITKQLTQCLKVAVFITWWLTLRNI